MDLEQYKKLMSLEIEAEERILDVYFKDLNSSEQREIRNWHNGALNVLRRFYTMLGEIKND